MIENRLKLYNLFDEVLEFDYRNNKEFLNETYNFVKRKIQDNKFKRNRKADKLIFSLDVEIQHYKSKFISYNYLNNKIDIVFPEYFIKKGYYYFALLHEVAHWTGNFCQTGRCMWFLEAILQDKIDQAQYVDYSIKEEATANIIAYLLCQHFGVNIELEMLMAQLIIESNWGKMTEDNQIKFLKSVTKDVLKAINFLTIELK